MTDPLTILGVDPGQSGAIACLTHAGRIVWIDDMPDATGAALGATIATLTRGEGVTVAVVERVASRPGQGVASVFKFGANYGAILGALGACAIPVEHVTPAKWKRDMAVVADKASSRQRARELWPESADLFRRVKDDGRAEAALIAEWGRTRGGLS